MENIIDSLLNYNNQRTLLKIYDLTMPARTCITFDRYAIERWFKTGLLENNEVALFVKNGVLTINSKYSELDKSNLFFNVSFFDNLPDASNKLIFEDEFFEIADYHGVWSDHWYSSVMSLFNVVPDNVLRNVKWEVVGNTDLSLLKSLVDMRLALSDANREEQLELLKLIGTLCQLRKTLKEMQ